VSLAFEEMVKRGFADTCRAAHVACGSAAVAFFEEERSGHIKDSIPLSGAFLSPYNRGRFLTFSPFFHVGSCHVPPDKKHWLRDGECWNEVKG